MPRRRKSAAPVSVPAPADPWAEAIAHLHAADPKFRMLTERFGPCPLQPRPDRFGTLVRAIIGQQISTSAARSIEKRLFDLAGTPHTPEGILARSVEELRSVGLSGVKVSYVRNLAESVAFGKIALETFDQHPDEHIVEALTTVKGIGTWTAHMFLIFALNRPDVLPTGDLGVRAGIRTHFGLAELPKPRECEELTKNWRPYRSVAMWYLWRLVENPEPKPAAAT